MSEDIEEKIEEYVKRVKSARRIEERLKILKKAKELCKVPSFYTKYL